MNLYLISQDSNNNYDVYDSAVVCCESEQEARQLHPSNDQFYWIVASKSSMTWCETPEQVTVKYLGVADASIPKGVVCASFNAG